MSKMDDWRSYILGPNQYLEDYRRTSEAAKAGALESMDRTLGQGLKHAAAVAGARGLSGGGGATQRMLGDVTQNLAQQKAQVGSMYDEKLASAMMADEAARRAAMNQLYGFEAQAEKEKEDQPKWYDYLLGGLSAVAPIAGGVLGGPIGFALGSNIMKKR